jgi:uncharacterized protein (TIGR02001 family)
LAALAVVSPGAARAQVAASAAIESDFRFRGFSLTDGHPAGTLQLSYDHPSGFNANAAASAVARGDAVDFLGYQVNAGFAQRVTPELSLDAGIVQRWFRYRYDYFGSTYISDATYPEAYVGAGVRNFSARVYYSPHYFRDDASTLYGEIEVGLEPVPGLRLAGHVGGLAYLTVPDAPFFDGRSMLDWRISASKQLGRFEVHTAVSGGAPETYHRALGENGTAVTVGASVNF